MKKLILASLVFISASVSHAQYQYTKGDWVELSIKSSDLNGIARIEVIDINPEKDSFTFSATEPGKDTPQVVPAKLTDLNSLQESLKTCSPLSFIPVQGVMKDELKIELGTFKNVCHYTLRFDAQTTEVYMSNEVPFNNLKAVNTLDSGEVKVAELVRFGKKE